MLPSAPGFLDEGADSPHLVCLFLQCAVSDSQRPCLFRTFRLVCCSAAAALLLMSSSFVGVQSSDAKFETDNQILSLTDQLNLGLRNVELDTHWVQVGPSPWLFPSCLQPASGNLQSLLVMLWVRTSVEATWKISSRLHTMADRLGLKMIDDFMKVGSAQDPSHVLDGVHCGAAQQLRHCNQLEAGKKLPCSQHGGMVGSCLIRRLRAVAVYALCH